MYGSPQRGDVGSMTWTGSSSAGSWSPSSGWASWRSSRAGSTWATRPPAAAEAGAVGSPRSATRSFTPRDTRPSSNWTGRPCFRPPLRSRATATRTSTRATSASTSTRGAASAGLEVRVLRVLAHEAADERADRRDPVVRVRPNVVERAGGQCRAEAVLLQGTVDLGVQELDQTLLRPVVDRLADLDAIALEHIAVVLGFVHD